MVLLTIDFISCGPSSYNVQVSNLSIVTLENINIENDIASNLYLSFNFWMPLGVNKSAWTGTV